MTRFPMGRMIAWLGTGWALKAASGVLERKGDMAIESGARLSDHLAALVLLVGALVCFVVALRIFWRWLKGGSPPTPKDEPVPTPVNETGDFDPDAALERYLQRRGAATDAPAPPAKGFGRKAV